MALGPPHSNMRLLINPKERRVRPERQMENKEVFFHLRLPQGPLNHSPLWRDKGVAVFGCLLQMPCARQGPAPHPCAGRSLNPFNPKKVGPEPRLDIPCSRQLGTEPRDSFKSWLSHSHVPRKGQNNGRASHCLPRRRQAGGRKS